MGCGKSKASNAVFDKTLAKKSGETAEKENPLELLRQYADKCKDATVDEIAAALSNLSVAERQRLEEVLGSNVVEAKSVEEPKPVEGPESLEDDRADVEAQPPEGTTNGDDKVEEASENGTGQQDDVEVTALEVPSGGVCAGCC